MIREDFKIIMNWLEGGSKVLDLGCGEGDLISHLTDEKNISGYGIEKDINKINRSINKGINVIHADFNEMLKEYFDDDFFDYAIMTQTLQENKNPDKLIREMLRVAKYAIVTFPNMGHWQNRLHLSFKGEMPISKVLPNNWYDTPNIHLCTFKDFENLCFKQGIKILEKKVLNRFYRAGILSKVSPNFFGEIALYKFTKKS
tara:strand:+ start:63 stop:665 length:603 start_codon:yes stop_codon:yes gene_type:complete